MESLSLLEMVAEPRTHNELHECLPFDKATTPVLLGTKHSIFEEFQLVPACTSIVHLVIYMCSFPDVDFISSYLPN